MGDVVDFAIQVLASSERRLEAAGQNVANITTPGYKRVISFDAYLSGDVTGASQEISKGFSVDQSPGRLLVTGSPGDLAIAGAGFFALNSAEGVIYTRHGQFHRDAEGHLATASGATLLGSDLGEIRVASGDFQVAEDGLVTSAGEPAGRIALMSPDDPAKLVRAGQSGFSAPAQSMRPLETATVRQGMLEASNVAVADEMVSVMEALRRAESGQRLVMVYDDLMGRVITAMGER